MRHQTKTRCAFGARPPKSRQLIVIAQQKCPHDSSGGNYLDSQPSTRRPHPVALLTPITRVCLSAPHRPSHQHVHHLLTSHRRQIAPPRSREALLSSRFLFACRPLPSLPLSLPPSHHPIPAMPQQYPSRGKTKRHRSSGSRVAVRLLLSFLAASSTTLAAAASGQVSEQLVLPMPASGPALAPEPPVPAEHVFVRCLAHYTTLLLSSNAC